MQIIGEASDGLEAVQMAQDLQPDLILLDVGLPTVNGIEAAQRIRRLSPDSKILFVSQQSSHDLAQAALDTGALGYVVKSDAAGELLPAVEAVLRGHRFVSSSLADHDLIKPQDEPQAEGEKAVSRFELQSVESNPHELRLYANDAAFMGDFARSLETALEKGSAVLVVATESHRANLLQQMRADGVDVDGAAERNLYISIDAADALSTVIDPSLGEDLPDGVPQAIVETLRAAKERRLRLVVG